MNLSSHNKSSARIGELTEEELVLALSNDSDFIKYGDGLMDLFEKMPSRDTFHSNYNESDFQEQGRTYFDNLSGYTDQELSEKVRELDDMLGIIYERYPQLKFDGSNEEFINRVIENASNEIAARGVSPACRACVKRWKPRMYAATILGAVVGGATGGLNGLLGGATTGFVSTGWALLDCLEDNGC